MTKRDFEMRTDGLGIGLFAIGVFCAVLVCQALFQGVAKDPGRLQMLAAIWVNAIGPVPSLGFQAALAGLGARLFLGSAPEAPRDTLRHVVGAAFVSAGLAILLGAFSTTAGGMFGDAIGGALATRTHAAVGALVGLAAIVATAWFVWLRPDVLPEEEAQNVRNPDLEEEEERADDGVSAAEAEALLPAEPVRVARAIAPPSPYPEDVRRRGEIPAGTRPIALPAAEATTAFPSAPSNRWTAPTARKNDAEPARALRRDDEDELADGDDRYALEDDAPQALAADAPVASVAHEVALPRPAWEDDEAVDAYGTPRSLVEALRRDGAPAHEAPEAAAMPITEPADVDDFEEELSEPVPLAARVDETPEASATIDVDDELELEPELDTVVSIEEDEDLLDEDESEDDDDEASDDEDVDDELAAAEAELAEVEADLAETETAFAQALADLETPTNGNALETTNETELVETNELETVVDLDTVATRDERVVLEPDARASTFFAETPPTEMHTETAPPTHVPEPAPAPAAETPPEPVAAELPSAKPTVRTLFDAAGPEDALAPDEEPVPAAAPVVKEKRSKRARPAPEPEVEPDPEPVEAASSIFSTASDSAEREVVLVPPAAPVERAVKTPAGTSSPRTALLAEVGCLFIERGRVAVSMLQRQYSMDFDDACKVLDELQDMGLIGPYLGGQRRDILLSRDAWLEKVGTS